MEVNIKDVEKLIELNKKNTFLNHFSNILFQDERCKGEIKSNKITVWKQNMWNMLFYPVFTFKFDANNHLFDIKDKLNPVGKLLLILLAFGFIWFISPKNLSDFNFIDNWKTNVVLFVFFTLNVWIAQKLYKFEKNNQLKLILQVLDVEVEEDIPEKEWSIKNLLLRLFLYPFSIFVIGVCIWSLLENGVGSFPMSIMGVAICGAYLYIDIKIIISTLKKSKRVNGK